MSSVIAVCCSDIHLSHRPPKLREAEPNWYAAQARVLSQVRAVVETHKCPLIVAGDVFDEGWRAHKCPPELVNFAIRHLPVCYAVPGQHDLPHHRYADVDKSAYQTLVEAGIVKDLPPGVPVCVGPLCLHGFPWGFPVKPPSDPGLALSVAVIHSYIWQEGSGYEKADEQDLVAHWAMRVGCYDYAIFGDNHKGFTRGFIHNCGGLQVRKVDELQYRPSLGLVWDSREITRHYLDTSQDKYADPGDTGKELATALDADGLARELKGLTTQRLFDFQEAVRQRLRVSPVSPRAGRILTKVLDAKT